MTPAHGADPQEPLATVLGRLTAEVDRIAAEAAALDGALGAVLSGAPARDPRLRASLQSADLLRQSVEGVALFLGALAARADPALRVDAAAAARGLPLRAQARALAPPASAPASAVTAPGAIDLW